MSLVSSLVLGMIVLAGLPIVWVWRVSPRCGGIWPLDIAMAGALFGLVFWAGPWVLVSYYLRYVALVVFLLGWIRAVWMLRPWALRLPTQASQRWGLVWRASVLVAVAVLDGEVLHARSCPDGAVEVRFPFSEGTYSVLQGGNSFVTNVFHRQHADERYAVDLVKLHALSGRARGMRPAALAAYEIFGAQLLAPCSGLVVQARDGLPDRHPGVPDLEPPAGNHLVIRCQELRLLLAHLQRGSIKVAVGDRVEAGQALGRVGNSGNTIEPHLHLSAVADGHAVPLSFRGRCLSLNSVYGVRGSW